MALQALNNFAATALENVGYGLKGWVQDSAVIEVATAATYYGVKATTDYQWITGVDHVEAALFVALTSSIYSIFQGILKETDDKESTISTLPNRGLIVLTNTATLALGGAYYFGWRLQAPYALTIAGLVYLVVKTAHDGWFF